MRGVMSEVQKPACAPGQKTTLVVQGDSDGTRSELARNKATLAQSVALVGPSLPSAPPRSTTEAPHSKLFADHHCTVHVSQ